MSAKGVTSRDRQLSSIAITYRDMKSQNQLGTSLGEGLVRSSWRSYRSVNFFALIVIGWSILVDIQRQVTHGIIILSHRWFVC